MESATEDPVRFDGFSECWYADEAAYVRSQQSAAWDELFQDGFNFLDMEALEANLALLASVQERAGCKILLALKGFAAWRTFFERWLPTWVKPSWVNIAAIASGSGLVHSTNSKPSRPIGFSRAVMAGILGNGWGIGRASISACG